MAPTKRAPLRTYIIGGTGASKRGSIVCTPQGQILYTSTIHTLTSKPSLVMYVGDKTDGVPVGAVSYPSFTSQMRLCVGDFDSSRAIWTDMTRHGWTSIGYDTLLPLPSGKQAPVTWKRTHDVEGTFKSMGGAHLKLVDGGNVVVARFVKTNWSLSEKGVLEIYQDLDDQEADLVIILSGLAMLEKARRRAANSAGGAGGGGGAG